ncbi:MAG: hypothetical protein ACOCUI_01245 [bacterium]
MNDIEKANLKRQLKAFEEFQQKERIDFNKFQKKLNKEDTIADPKSEDPTANKVFSNLNYDKLENIIQELKTKKMKNQNKLTSLFTSLDLDNVEKLISYNDLCNDIKKNEDLDVILITEDNTESVNYLKNPIVTEGNINVPITNVKTFTKSLKTIERDIQKKFNLLTEKDIDSEFKDVDYICSLSSRRINIQLNNQYVCFDKANLIEADEKDQFLLPSNKIIKKLRFDYSFGPYPHPSCVISISNLDKKILSKNVNFKSFVKDGIFAKITKEEKDKIENDYSETKKDLINYEIFLESLMKIIKQYEKTMGTLKAYSEEEKTFELITDSKLSTERKIIIASQVINNYIIEDIKNNLKVKETKL